MPEHLTVNPDPALLGSGHAAGKVLSSSGLWVYPAVGMAVPLCGPAEVAWLLMPAAATFLLGSAAHVTRCDLSNFSSARLVLNRRGVAGAVGSKIALCYAAAYSGAVGDYSDIGTSEVACDIETADTVASSGWIALAESAKDDVFLAVIGSGGDGVASPVLGSIFAQFQ